LVFILAIDKAEGLRAFFSWLKAGSGLELGAGSDDFSVFDAVETSVFTTSATSLL
jgi:hypothetical protein